MPPDYRHRGIKKEKENLLFFGKYQNISSHVLEILAISLVLCTTAMHS